MLGVSFDSVEENRAFAEKCDFPYRLLCDTTRSMGMAYGVARKADAKYPERVTYIIDADGVIEHAEKVTDIEAHVASAVARLRDV